MELYALHVDMVNENEALHAEAVTVERADLHILYTWLMCRSLDAIDQVEQGLWRVAFLGIKIAMT